MISLDVPYRGVPKLHPKWNGTPAAKLHRNLQRICLIAGSGDYRYPNGVNFPYSLVECHLFLPAEIAWLEANGIASRDWICTDMLMLSFYGELILFEQPEVIPHLFHKCANGETADELVEPADLKNKEFITCPKCKMFANIRYRPNPVYCATPNIKQQAPNTVQ